MINMKLAELAKVNMEIEQLEMKRKMLQRELENLSSGDDKIQISKESFWNNLNQRATIYQENSSVYHSYSGKSRYSIYNVQNDKIFTKTSPNYFKKTRLDHPRTRPKLFKIFDFFDPRSASTTSKSTSQNHP